MVIVSLFLYGLMTFYSALFTLFYCLFYSLPGFTKVWGGAGGRGDLSPSQLLFLARSLLFPNKRANNCQSENVCNSCYSRCPATSVAGVQKEGRGGGVPARDSTQARREEGSAIVFFVACKKQNYYQRRETLPQAGSHWVSMEVIFQDGTF